MHAQPLIVKLFEIGAVRFGSFPLKNGSTSPIYIDLGLIFAYPKLLVALSEALYDRVRGQNFEILSVATQTALPLATAISIEHSLPLVLVHQEKPEYALDREIFRPKQPCLILDDLISTGQSILQTIAALERKGLSTEHVAVLIDREGKGRKRLSDLGYQLHALFTLSQIIAVLQDQALIDEPTASTVLAFLNK